jgi:hypothetical protein
VDTTNNKWVDVFITYSSDASGRDLLQLSTDGITFPLVNANGSYQSANWSAFTSWQNSTSASGAEITNNVPYVNNMLKVSIPQYINNIPNPYPKQFIYFEACTNDPFFSVTAAQIKGNISFQYNNTDQVNYLRILTVGTNIDYYQWFSVNYN